MLKYRIKRIEYRLIVTVKLPFRDRIEEQQLNFFSKKSMKGLFKVQKAQKRKVEYIGAIGISLAERLKKPVNKYDFFFIVEQVIDILQRVNANGLSAHCLILNVENVYINEVTKELQFIYLPIFGQMPGIDVVSFLESLIYSARPALENDMEYLSRFAFFMNHLQGFDPEKIEKFIAREDARIISAIKQSRKGNSGFLTDKPLEYYEYYDIDEEETGLLEIEEETELLTCEEETDLLPENLVIRNAKLFRIATQECIRINKEMFRIGKEEGVSDYAVMGNDKISRSHIDIITKGSRYYVLDLNSRNRTYINGRVIAIQEEVELFDGDVLKLANEEFVFRV